MAILGDQLIDGVAAMDRWKVHEDKAVKQEYHMESCGSAPGEIRGRGAFLPRRIIAVLAILFVPIVGLFLPWNLASVAVIWLASAVYGAFFLTFGTFASTARSDAEMSQATATLPFVSIIVPAANEESVLPRLLETLERLDYLQDGLPNFEILVVDHGSEDSTRDILLDAGRRTNIIRPILLPSSAPKGKSRALNAGLGEAKGDIVCVLDADAVVSRSFLRQGVGQLLRPGVSAVQCRKLFYNSDASILTYFQAKEYEVVKRAFQRARNLLGSVVAFSGNGMLIWTDVIRYVGGWNERALTEDVDLALRLKAAGLLVVYAEDIVVWEEPILNPRHFLRQRTRWAQGFVQMLWDALPRLVRSSNGSLPLRLDAILMICIPLIVPTSFWLALLVYAVGFLWKLDLALDLSYRISLPAFLSIFFSLTIASSRFSEHAPPTDGRIPVWCLAPMIGLYYLHSLLTVPAGIVREVLGRKASRDWWLKTAHYGVGQSGKL